MSLEVRELTSSCSWSLAPVSLPMYCCVLNKMLSYVIRWISDLGDKPDTKYHVRYPATAKYWTWYPTKNRISCGNRIYLWIFRRNQSSINKFLYIKNQAVCSVLYILCIFELFLTLIFHTNLPFLQFFSFDHNHFYAMNQPDLFGDKLSDGDQILFS